MHQRADNGWRRLAAGAVDYGIVVAYLAVLTLVGVLLLYVAMLLLGAHRPPYDRLAGTLVRHAPQDPA